MLEVHIGSGASFDTVRFEELHKAGEPPKIGTLYVQKWALSGLDLTKDFQVTIEEA